MGGSYPAHRGVFACVRVRRGGGGGGIFSLETLGQGARMGTLPDKVE